MTGEVVIEASPVICMVNEIRESVSSVGGTRHTNIEPAAASARTFLRLSRPRTLMPRKENHEVILRRERTARDAMAAPVMLRQIAHGAPPGSGTFKIQAARAVAAFAAASHVVISFAGHAEMLSSMETREGFRSARRRHGVARSG